MDIGSEALGLVGTVAPTIATALGGPLAGWAVQAVCGALGLPKDAKPADVKAALVSPTADQLLALKQAEDTFKQQMRQLDIDLAKIGQADTANARARQIALPHDWTPTVLAGVLTVGFFALVFLMATHMVPPENAGAVNILIGTLGTGWVQSIAYYFGSSYGSKSKDALLFQSVPATAAPDPSGQANAAGGLAHAAN